MSDIIYSIYKITNTINNKCYIGYTEQPPVERWRQHQTSSNTDKTKVLYKAMRKYGLEKFTFEIICQSLDGQYTLEIMENYFIDKFNSSVKNGRGYNVMPGGLPVNKSLRSEETRKSISGPNHYLYGKHPSEETRRKQSEAHKGVKLSEATIKKRRGRKGNFSGKKHTITSREKNVGSSGGSRNME